MEFEDILESAKLSKGKRITDDGKLVGVHLLGLKSKNGYTYAMEAINAAHKLYEGLDIFLNHKDPESAGDRDIATKIGFIEKTYVTESVGMEGDVQFNTGHPMFPAIKWWVENRPDKAGFSHIAQAKLNKLTKVMEEIRKPTSVDLVSTPATTNGFFKESFDGVAEGVVVDKLEERKVSLLHEAYCALFWETYYNQGKALTTKELAVKLVPVVKDLLQELEKYDDTTKESVMKIEELTIDELKAKRADLVSVVAQEAVAAEKAVDAKVTELTKDLDTKAKSPTFLKLVRESVVAGKDVAELIADRKELFTAAAVVVESALPAPKKEGTAEKKEDAPKFTMESVVAALKKTP